MKKRITALLLCLLMLLSVCLTSCGEEDDDVDSIEATSSREPVTLSMWVVTGENTTEEAMLAVEEAFSAYTKSNFTTAVELVFVTEDEYETALADYYKAIKEYRASVPAVTETTTVSDDAAETTAEMETEAETFVNQYGVPEIKYPETEEYQIDIVLLLGSDMYYEYANGGKLQSMSSSLIDVSKKLKDYIYPYFFDAAKVSSGTMAIPNNHAVGEYTYLLVNRELAAKYYIDVEDISTVKDCMPLLEDIARNEKTAPIKSPFECPNIKYWSADGSFSVLASDYTVDAQPKNIFEIDSYVEYLELTSYFKSQGYYAENPDTDDFGIAVIKGTAADVEKYGDKYEIKVIGYPFAESDDLLEASFGVSSYSKYFERAMEVIVALNTSSELRNILQYGVADVTYTLGTNDTVESLKGNYEMNLRYTGNEFVALKMPGVTDDDVAAQKKQNLESVESPYLALDASGAIDVELYTALDKFSAEIEKMIDERVKVNAFSDTIEMLREKVESNEAFIAATDLENPASVSSACASKVK